MRFLMTFNIQSYTRVTKQNKTQKSSSSLHYTVVHARRFGTAQYLIVKLGNGRTIHTYISILRGYAGVEECSAKMFDEVTYEWVL